MRRNEMMKIILRFCEALLLLLLVILPRTKAVCPGDETICGNISIPYPFGLSPKCARSKDLVLSCNQTFNPPKLSFKSSRTKNGKNYTYDIEVINISLEQGLLQAKTPVVVFNFSEFTFGNYTPPLGYRPFTLPIHGPYTISQRHNLLTAVGCGAAASLTNTDFSENLVMCAQKCSSANLTNGYYKDIGCCQTSIPPGLRSYGLKARLLHSTSSFSHLAKIFLVEKDKFTCDSLYMDPNSSHLNHSTMFPFVLEWVVNKTTCDIAARDLTTFACISKNSTCIPTEPGYICNCSSGYQGNPYISNGCQVVVVLAGVGASFGLLVVLALLFLVHRKWKARNLKKTKRRNYQCNHGMLLEKLISLDEGGVCDQGFMVFPLTEIEKATNNFDATRILGNGGHATVYKGLLSDKRVVAIKKSKLINPQEIKEFINEVFILSRIRHRNVVKLLGCCLETEVPLLVYEFIPNGTLAEHLHMWQRPSSLSWDDRLRIASETAGALAHLHCDIASISVFHRDVKTSNILLDSNFTAKVSDFGASRSIPLHESATAGLATVAQGTFGYLDPEYYSTGQLTQKSDVYSFGVILAELLTGEKPISQSRPGGQANLRTYFVSATKENCIFKIVEPHIVNNNTRKDIEAVAMLAETCLKMKGDERPTMKEVEMALMSLRWSKKQQHQHPWNSSEKNEEIEQLFYQDYPQLSRFNDHYDSTGNYSLEMQLMSSSSIEYPH
ncbi:hypothetical protein J5N97_002001 [Dioscorea zingiberensis]|uniref:Protein kinase domain-containing protein n=1 Tax=Dioscorea zingiberensis TaxID=325984 RepID=A0A9D5BVP6_9LILI|nr:hypothetical protein J5N97_002001 [Dioscorea zingiberensis]